MSASDTNLNKQTRNHRPALIGIAVAVIAAGVFFVYWNVGGNSPAVDEATSAEPAVETQPLVQQPLAPAD